MDQIIATTTSCRTRSCSSPPRPMHQRPGSTATSFLDRRAPTASWVSGWPVSACASPRSTSSMNHSS